MMRRRALLAAAPLAAGLVACDSDRTADSGTAVVTVDPAVTQREEPLEQIDPASVNLPLDMTAMAVVATDWTATPLHLDGVLLGYGDEGEHLRFTAADQQGTLLWEALRPLACTGAALSRDRDDRAIAVLPDVSAEDGRIAAVSLTGYDLATAEILWGPAPVPGPQAAPGLVFAGTGDQPMGEGGPRVALDAGTGELALAEEDLEGGRILAEHLGMVLHTEGGDLVATSATEGTESWRITLPARLDPQEVHIRGAIDPDSGLAVVAATNEAGAVIDVRDGRVVSSSALHACYDHATQMTVLATGATVQGVSDSGSEQWRHDDPEQLELIGAGERLAYARRSEEGTLVVLDTSRGIMVHPYEAEVDGPLAIPELFTAEAAAVVRTADQRFLVTTEFDEEYGPFEE